MHTPDPLLLRSIRVLLLLMHGVGVAVIFLPFIYSISPGDYLVEMLNNLDEVARGFRSSISEGVFWTTLPLSFLGAAVIWLLQIRSFFDSAMRGYALRLALASMWVFIVLACVLHLAFAFQTVPRLVSYSGSDWPAICAVLALAVVGITGLIALSWIGRRRRLHRFVKVHAGLRYAYVFGVGMSLLGFGLTDGLEIGGWLSFAMCGLYAIEAIIFFVYGKADPSGGASSAILRYWLPRGDADPHPDLPVCATCGYDLRGTIPVGGRICPECGTAVPLSEPRPEGSAQGSASTLQQPPPGPQHRNRPPIIAHEEDSHGHRQSGSH